MSGTREAKLSLAHKVPPPTGAYRWVYLWEWPIRIMHWLAVAGILTLVVTGLYIGRPYFMTGGEASSHFLMGRVRFAHFTAAAVLVMTGIVRGYWLFMGNRYERLRALFPLRRRDWVNLVRMVKFYLMIRPERAPHYLGHNPLQQLSYTALYAITGVMVLSGFALYGQSDPGGFIYSATNWIGPLLGGMPNVRFVHHALTWAFLIFVPIHVYLAIRADHLERTGVISSIVSGGRFVPVDHHFVDE
ncbi:MAG: Ni/Fe-hydrogenase, b-type cytochrome subunit [Gemmatimonadales bacterium]|nr:Ni/Fe-hydrogenase, b-type cytochrome subunit [Gemmatimonadales bacterium]